MRNTNSIASSSSTDSNIDSTTTMLSPSRKSLEDSASFDTAELFKKEVVRSDFDASWQSLRVDEPAAIAPTQTPKEAQPPKKKKEKKVTFNKRAQVRRTISRKNFTIHELEATWYTPDERTKTLLRARREVQMIENGKVLKDRKFCSRGLERQTRKGRVDSATLVQDCLTAVWEEQARQWTIDEDDQDRIASIYSKMTVESQKEARRMAEVDAHYVMKFVL